MQTTFSTGPIQAGNLLNILQRLSLKEQDVRLLQIESSGRVGELWACGKHIISARLGSSIGKKALATILELDRGNFALLSSSQSPTAHFHEAIEELYLEPEIPEEDRELARVMNEANEPQKDNTPKKISFWQRLINKRQMFAPSA